MMKFHTAIATCLATYFVSGMSQDSEAILALSKQLRQTEHSLDVMKQLKERKDTDPEAVTALLLSATEPAIEGQSELDRRLLDLRQELSVLHMETEIILGTGDAPQHNPGGEQSFAQGGSRNAQPSGMRRSGETPKMVSGLSPYVLSLLKQTRQPKSLIAQPSGPKSKAAKGAELMGDMPTSDAGALPKRSIKLTGYSANPMLQAKASYRAGLYEDCLTILAKQKGSEADHLRSRCLTRLNRMDEAINNLTRIITLEPESQLGKRAAEDKKFAIWMMAANEQLAKDNAKKGDN